MIRREGDLLDREMDFGGKDWPRGDESCAGPHILPHLFQFVVKSGPSTRPDPISPKHL